MNINIEGTDRIVGEYLIYRGFTQTLQTLEIESSRDRTKKFDVARIVETIFNNLVNFEIENFVLLWDFLNKRFFFHLDAEHYNLCCTLKSDLLKFYLVHAVKSKNRDRVAEFFSAYSHEILAEGGSSIPGTLRNWFVLPYLDEPDKDNDFAVYFSQRWADLLKITLHNFLSVVLSSAPPPKLLLLEKWYRSEAQQEMRSQFTALSKKIDKLSTRCERYEDRLQALRESLRSVCSLLHKTTLTASHAPSKANQSALFDQEESEMLAEERRTKLRELGSSTARLAGECVAKNAAREKGVWTDPTEGEALAHATQLEELEREFLAKVNEWTTLLSSCHGK